MPVNADQEIQRLYENLKGKGQEQAEATLLLALKIRDVEVALIDAKRAVEGVQQALAVALDHGRGAFRTTDQPKKG